MSIDQLKELRTAESILFLGSGFSRNAINIRGNAIPTGEELKRELAHALSVDENLYDFQTLAEEVNSREKLNLYQMLYELFTVRELHEHQVNVLQKPWRRIYTTNYDDGLELHYHNSKQNINSFSYTDPKPNRMAPGTIVHLHGMIRLANQDNILEQLVLTESSYVRQHFEKSLWYDEFIHDLRFCQMCIFVGYSLRDYHISSILLQHRETTEKTYFITSGTVDAIFSRRIAPYGEVLPVGIEGFSDHCRNLSEPTSTGNIHTLRSFRYLDPLMDKKSLSSPTALEILNLVTYGTFNFRRCLSTLPNSEYIVARRAQAEEAAALLDNTHTLILHSLLGNGKSIFLYILAHRLAQKEYKCFLARTNTTLLPEDVAVLRDIKEAVLMFDDYDSARDIIDEMKERLPMAKVIVAVRTGIQDVRLHEIQNRFPAPIQRLNLNKVSRSDLEEFCVLLDQSGIRTENLEEGIRNCKDFREVVTTLYDHSEIKQKISDELKPLMDDSEIRKIIVASHLLRWAGHEVDPGFLRSVTNCDAYAAMARFRAIATEIFRLDDDQVHVRSPIFSEYIIQTHIAAADILDGVYPIIVEAVKRKHQKRYQGILSSLMRFSILNRALVKEPRRIELLIGLYEKLRRDIDVNKEPLFWLQYSILMTAADDLYMAEDLIRTAYARAKDSPGFLTFQIDTFALRLMLLIEQREVSGETVQRFDQIVGKIDEIRQMIGEESRRDHAIQVLMEIEPFVRARLIALSTAERTSLVYHLALIQQELGSLSDIDRARTGADKVSESVGRARQAIVG